MKIAMIGSGAAGSVFACYLRKAGADITLVDPYAEHMETVAEKGMDFTIMPDQFYHLDGFKTACSAEDIGIMDIIIFMTKATCIDAGLRTARPAIGETSVLVSLMNGVGNEDPLVAEVGAGRVIYGSGTLGTKLEAPGKCISLPSKSEYQMNFGAVERTDLTIAAGAYLETCFNDGGCATKFWENVSAPMWTKATYNCVYNPLSALTRLKCNVLIENDYGYRLIETVVRECLAVANAKGVYIDPEKFMVNVKRSSASPITDYYPSMAQDMLMYARETEITTLNERISDYGKKLGIPTPANDFIVNMIHVMQDNYERQYKG